MAHQGTFRTVLILGAGASISHGFPSAIELKKRVIADLEGNELQYRLLLPKSPPWEKATQELHSLVQHSPISSIDVLVNMNPQVAFAARIAIASVMLERESTSLGRRLMPNDEGDDWYQWLFNHTMSILTHRANALITVVTFNYERSLSEYLIQSFRDSSIGTSREQAISTLRSVIRLYHVHGSIGGDALEVSSQSVTVPYGRQGPEPVRLAAEKLKLIHDGSRDERLHEAIRDEISEASQIVFLGMSYGDDNLKLILPRARGKTYKLSRFGLTGGEIAQIKDRIYQLSDSGALSWSKEEKCLDFLRRRISLFQDLGRAQDE